MLSLIFAAALASTGAMDEGFDARCAALAGQRGDLTVTSAAVLVDAHAPDGAAPNYTFKWPEPLPKHCLVRGELGARTGADGRRYAIHLELRVPEAWNGRLLFQGGAGLDGFVAPALGAIAASSQIAPPLAQGFAVVSSDSGHTASSLVDTSFAKDQQAKLDYGYAYIGKVSASAKELTTNIARRPPHHTYFAGCSNGGREAMMAAQRFPSEFDGVLACNPAFRLSHAVILSNFSGQVYTEAAEKAGALPTRWITPADAALFQKALLEDCDDLDGAKDGMIFDHAACHFDIRKIQCRQGQAQGCLAPTKVAAISRAFAGPRDAKGRPIVGAWAYDTGNFTPMWLVWQVGIEAPPGTMLRDLVHKTLTEYFLFPPRSGPLLGGDSEAQALVEQTSEAAAFTDAVSTDLTSFEARGGKMMLVTGWSDPIFSATDLIDWYGQMSSGMEKATGRKADAFARLYLVPGMLHGAGGPSLAKFDALSALVAWVENNSAPAQLIATGTAFPNVSRPICAYPHIARYSGSGPKDAAESFACR